MGASASPKSAFFLDPHVSVAADVGSSEEDVVDVSVDEGVTGKKAAVCLFDQQRNGREEA